MYQSIHYLAAVRNAASTDRKTLLQNLMGDQLLATGEVAKRLINGHIYALRRDAHLFERRQLMLRTWHPKESMLKESKDWSRVTVDFESRLSDIDHRRRNYQSQRQTDFYLYLRSQDSLDVRKNNSSSDFWIQLPKTYSLEGQWVCTSKQLSFICDFKPKSKRLYLCCNIVEESYVRNTLFPMLRNIEIENKFKKYKSETFEEGTLSP